VRGPLIALALIAAAPARAEDAPEITVYAAGSTTGALTEILDRYMRETGRRVRLRTGPAGLLRERIEAGDAVDLFVSANLAHPERLRAAGKAGPVAVFARNRLCVTGRRALKLTPRNLLARLLDPRVRIGTSTPGADPGGDYAQALFSRADALRPGATATLRAKARAIVGGKLEPATPAPRTALEGLDAAGVDVTIGYCSARTPVPDRSVDKVPVPDELAVPIDYGLTILTTAHDAAREAAAGQLAVYLLSPAAQSSLPAFGFLPAVVVRAGTADSDLVAR